MAYLPDWLIDFITGKHPYAAVIALAGLAFATMVRMGYTDTEKVYFIFLVSIVAIIWLHLVSNWKEYHED